jgi:hypothetical protein
VADHLDLSSVSHKWNVNFLRAGPDWVVDLFTSFTNLLYSLRFCRGGEDKRVIRG